MNNLYHKFGGKTPFDDYTGTSHKANRRPGKYEYSYRP
jgi:hypothetical protein